MSDSEGVPVDFEFPADSGEGTSVEVVKKLISPDVDGLPMVASNSSPKHYALVFSKADYGDRVGKKVGIKFGEQRRRIGNYFLKFELSRRGKGNRAEMVADVSKALAQMEFEIKKSAGSKLMGQ